AALAESHPEETEWAFAFTGLESSAGGHTIPEPAVRGAVPVVPYAEGEKPPFGIRRIEEKPEPASLADFGIADTAKRPGPVTVLLPRSVRDALLHRRPFSHDVEEGGFLTGRVYAERDRPGTSLAHVTDAPAAESTGASLLHLTFTGDSFGAIKR